ncbi:hypothetical protein [Paenibacillus dokdonensis]|uniref:hypothetical protein n=1 Tax=Paenibacillus dokdonensis TaxID=2567944 RepID=UPI003D26AB53
MTVFFAAEEAGGSFDSGAERLVPHLKRISFCMQDDGLPMEKWDQVNRTIISILCA